MMRDAMSNDSHNAVISMVCVNAMTCDNRSMRALCLSIHRQHCHDNRSNADVLTGKPNYD